MTPRLIMVRHGESTANAGARGETPSGTPLTPIGHQQAVRAAYGLLDLGLSSPDVVAVSPFLRTQQTAKPYLRAIHGHSWVWPIEEWVFLDPKRYEGTTQAERQGDVRAYVERGDPYADDGGAGESFFTFIHRVDFFLQVARTWGTSVAFTHGRFIRGVLWRIANPGGFLLSQAEFRSFWAFSDQTEVHNCQRFELRYENGRWAA